MLDRPEDHAEKAVKFKEAGWAAYKVHPPGEVLEDLRICEAVRRAVGDDYPIMLDSTWSYDYPDAIRVGVAIQEMGFYWYEDPLAADDLYSYVKLKQQLHIPIMATELPMAGPRSYAPWVMEQATDYLRGDVYLKGRHHVLYEDGTSGGSLPDELRDPPRGAQIDFDLIERNKVAELS